jgi:hypothetical protein
VAKLYFVLLLIFLGGCAIEEAQPQNDAQLIMATDFLSKEQKRVLVKVAKRRKLELRILDLSADEIRTALRKKPWEPGFDMVLLGSLESQNALKHIDFQYQENNYGVIPIGVSYVPDSIIKLPQFKDLSAHYLWAAADKHALGILKANLNYIYRNRENVNSVNKAYSAYTRGLRDHKLAFDNYNLHNTLLLCRFDTYLDYLKKEVPSRLFTYALPDHNKFFADYIGLYIIEQCNHYSNAKKMLHFLHYLRDNKPKFRSTFGIIKKPSKRKQPTPQTLLDFLEK